MYRIVDVRLLDLDKILLQITKYEVATSLNSMTYDELCVLCIPMPCDMCIV